MDNFVQEGIYFTATNVKQMTEWTNISYQQSVHPRDSSKTLCISKYSIVVGLTQFGVKRKNEMKEGFEEKFWSL